MFSFMVQNFYFCFALVEVQITGVHEMMVETEFQSNYINFELD